MASWLGVRSMTIVSYVADLNESCREMYMPRRFMSSATSSMAPTPPLPIWEEKEPNPSAKGVPGPHSPRRSM